MRPNTIAAGEYLTTFQAAEILQVAFSTVNYWIDEGKLKGFKTPGGHRRIKRADLRAFMDQYGYTSAKPEKPVVLIVDDEPEIRKLIKRFLEKSEYGFDIKLAANAWEAGAAMTESQPDILILDIELPGIDGFQIMAETLKRDNPPVIFVISGHHRDAYEKKALEHGARAFFAKPLDFDLLRRSVEQTMAKTGS